ncbi:uncharacterized protein BDR25DRAFT_326552 [Lindgomyces ingoldianus]|uniref:Uncharacterized protein n=1 Tax=Lindgomyces ingoldianus TaxID=673940 RepID=A0ACB6QPG9_9PLEO|nr:uncharacterized protein BDR25DRAFT_326552 [Lindgomyces ingoldianus]KAF2468873.1 hypothetical protein BDR25DRAFT_326552 [Lindgomyces ingoldianus]
MLFLFAFAPLALFAIVHIYHLAMSYITARNSAFLSFSFQSLSRMCDEWLTVDENRTASRLGENFVLSSPPSNQVVTCYPPGISRIFGDHKNWPQPAAQSQLFAFYGQNVSSTIGTEWQRHRKITASAFTEKKKCINKCISSLLLGLAQNTALTTIPPGHRQSLTQCLGLILKHVILTLVLHGVKAPNFLLPSVLRQLKVSLARIKIYMEETVLRHMQLSNEDKPEPRTTSLLPIFVPSYLAESNSSTMKPALSFLTAHPDIQDWVIEEVATSYSSNPNREHANLYPKLVRCLALMCETLELPITTSSSETTITLNPGTLVNSHFYGAHFPPLPERGVFLPWIFGSRVCPGKKFSQVEFVAIITHLLPEFHIKVQRFYGESVHLAKASLMGVLDEKYFNIVRI